MTLPTKRARVEGLLREGSGATNQRCADCGGDLS
ncbi:hypothetical protein Pla86_08810 [Planctomycetes bacterium Pla86]|uniref:Uncharacterized protein n=1 Tax=Engelhardtia mirabilis TaxID=2528011 RepID=A0A518BFS9_9BACT|nr:hypothetical protein Pla133_08820 [Planctomycetes bacterium Pla133]QDV00142.1 hypothetical protein Pla86_08810 [Planctomycetes bacterium Pla86]